MEDPRWRRRAQRGPGEGWERLVSSVGGPSGPFWTSGVLHCQIHVSVCEIPVISSFNGEVLICYVRTFFISWDVVKFCRRNFGKI